MQRKTLTTRLKTNRYLLRLMYYPWIALPYAPRRLVTIVGVSLLQYLSRARGNQRRQAPTPSERLFSLSFWGVPKMRDTDFVLTVGGSVERPASYSLEQIRAMPGVDRAVTMDCVGGSRNNCRMRGVSFTKFVEQVAPTPDAHTAVFRCADGYHTTLPVEDLVNSEAFLAYAINAESVAEHGYPLRLVAPGKYGYKWAKWVKGIEFVTGSPKGYWESRGLPDRAQVGDIR